MLKRERIGIGKNLFAWIIALVMLIGSIGIVPINAKAATPKYVKKISLSETELEMGKGDTEQIKYKVYTYKGASKKIKLKISNNKVLTAKVRSGKIILYSKSVGKCVVTVVSKGKNKRGKKIAKKIKVTVEEENDDDLDYDYDEDSEEKNTSEQVKSEQPTNKQTNDEQITTEQPVSNQSISGKMEKEQPTSEQAKSEQTNNEDSTSQKPNNGQVPSEQAKSEQTNNEDSTSEKANKGQMPSEQATNGQLNNEEPTSEQTNNGQIPSEQEKSEQANNEDSTSEQPKNEQITSEERADEQITDEQGTDELNDELPTLTYQVHVEDVGWQSEVGNAQTAGTTGQSKAIEAIKITFNGFDGKNAITYNTHLANKGWQGWKNGGEISGTTGERRQMEAIQIKLNDTMSKYYDIYYRTYVDGYGWLGWAKNGEISGSTGFGLAIDAIQINIIEKNASFDVGGSSSLQTPKLTYQAHVEDVGWQNEVGDAQTAGTTGQSKAIEAIKITFNGFDGKNAITYNSHLANIGWQGWKNGGEISGTTGDRRQMEAIQIKLNDTMSKYFDIYYRMHVQDKGWLGWAANGEPSGTVYGGLRAEAIQISVVPKGSSFERNGTAYYELTPATQTNQSQNGYSAQAAIDYAHAHAYDGVGQCAEFVSKCLTAGGLPNDSKWGPNVGVDPQTGWNNWTTTSLKDYLVNKGYTIIYNPRPDQILPGNPVFYSTRSDYATSHTGTKHAAICVSNDGGNNPKIAAHNSAHDNYSHSYMMKGFEGCCTVLINK